VLTLQPNNSNLAAYAASRLQPALDEAIQTLVLGRGAAAARVADGELRLPLGELSPSSSPLASWTRSGITLPFNEANANLLGLDGQGGTYLRRMVEAAPRLTISADGLLARQELVVVAQYSPRNVHSTYGAFTSMYTGVVNFVGPICLEYAQPVPDITPMFLAWVDKHGWIQGLVALRAPQGSSYTPECLRWESLGLVVGNALP
jgi:hypothetical protein